MCGHYVIASAGKMPTGPQPGWVCYNTDSMHGLAGRAGSPLSVIGGAASVSSPPRSRRGLGWGVERSDALVRPAKLRKRKSLTLILALFERERRHHPPSAGKMPTGPTARMAVLQYLAEGADAFLVLVHGADGDADPFRQVVAFHRAHDHFVLKQGAENCETIPNLHQNKICRAGHEWKFHPGKFFLEKGAPFVDQSFCFMLMSFVGQRRKRADLTDAVDVEGLSCFVHHLDQFRPGDAIADTQTRQSMNLRKGAEGDHISSIAHVAKRVGHFINKLVIGFVEHDHYLRWHPRHETLDRIGR